MGSKKKNSDPNVYNNQARNLLKKIQSAQGKGEIDATSAEEASNMLYAASPNESGYQPFHQGQQFINAASEYFSKAVEGVDPKFKSRRQTELLYKTMIDQPGRKQFVFGAGGSRRSGNTGLLGA